jgi:hypothetical protein
MSKHALTMTEDFHTGVCGCCEDVPGCCMAMFCPCVVVGNNASQVAGRGPASIIDMCCAIDRLSLIWFNRRAYVVVGAVCACVCLHRRMCFVLTLSLDCAHSVVGLCSLCRWIVLTLSLDCARVLFRSLLSPYFPFLPARLCVCVCVCVCV